MKRSIYLLLFGVPGFFISFIATYLIGGMIMGAVFFIFGDGQWPIWTQFISSEYFFVGMWATLWALSLILGFQFGKRKERENNNPIDKRHIFFSVGITVVSVACILLGMLREGTLGPKSIGQQCSDICVAKGNPISSLSAHDAVCSCFDDAARKWIPVQ